MTAPFPTRKQEEWRYADLDALKPVWEQFAEPVTLTVSAGETLEEVWLPVADDVQLRRVQLALGEGAKARIFALNTAPVYGRIELEVSLPKARISSCSRPISAQVFQLTKWLQKLTTSAREADRARRSAAC